MSNGGPFSPPPDGPFAGLTVGQQLLMGLGILLLLPGGCALFFIVAMTAENPTGWVTNPYMRVFLPLMLLCLLVSAGGVWIIVAVRRARRPRP